MAAFPSAVRDSRKRSYWERPGYDVLGGVTLVTPSISAEMWALTLLPH